MTLLCLMNGALSPRESDKAPCRARAVCLEKLAWNVGFDPARRRTEGIAEEAR